MSDTYFQLSRSEIELLISETSNMSLMLRLGQRLNELDDPEVQKRWRSYRDAVETSDGELEVDDNALVSESDDGAYVMTWSWVSDPTPHH